MDRKSGNCLAFSWMFYFAFSIEGVKKLSRVKFLAIGLCKLECYFQLDGNVLALKFNIRGEKSTEFFIEADNWFTSKIFSHKQNQEHKKSSCGSGVKYSSVQN